MARQCWVVFFCFVVVVVGLPVVCIRHTSQIAQNVVEVSGFQWFSPLDAWYYALQAAQQHNATPQTEV